MLKKDSLVKAQKYIHFFPHSLHFNFFFSPAHQLLHFPVTNGLLLAVLRTTLSLQNAIRLCLITENQFIVTLCLLISMWYTVKRICSSIFFHLSGL